MKIQKIKRKENILKYILITFLITFITFSGSLSFAASSFVVKNTGRSQNLLRYNKKIGGGHSLIDIKTTYAAVVENGKTYPAYCLNLERPGVEKDGSYKVNVKGIVTTPEIYRVIVNGHPYKSLKELGVKTKEEAYTATKQAVYTILYNRNVKDYSASDTPAGKRTYAAYLKIIKAAKSSKEVYNSGFLKMNIDDNWNYYKDKIIRKFDLKSDKVGEAELDLKTKFKGISILDKNKQKITSNKVDVNSTMYVAVDLDNLKSMHDKSIEIKASANLVSNPVFYSMPKNQKYQNYAISGFKTIGKVFAKGNVKITNNTNLKIKKIDSETTLPMQNVTFELKTQKGKIIGKFKTDENGYININNFIPGKYVLTEVDTNKGYEKLDKPFDFSIDYNESKELIVENKRIKLKPKIVKEKKSVKRILPRTGY